MKCLEEGPVRVRGTAKIAPATQRDASSNDEPIEASPPRANLRLRSSSKDIVFVSGAVGFADLLAATAV